LLASKVAPHAVQSVARALVCAEADGHRGHGLSRIIAYTGQAKSGKLDGFAIPKVETVKPGLLRADAAFGFAYPAIDLAFEHLPAAAQRNGIAAVAVTRSHHIGVAGQHAERLAEQGFMALVFSNGPKAMAPFGGKSGLYGTNPIAFAIPRGKGAPLVIDLALSLAARGLVMAAKQKGETIPEGWALDVEGRPTTDAEAALAGTMVPAGGAKGAALALMIEMFAGAFIGANFAYEASSLFDDQGPAPDIGQLIIAIDAGCLRGLDFVKSRVEEMLAAIEAQGARIPGSRRLENRARAQAEGVQVSKALFEDCLSIAKISRHEILPLYRQSAE
jgi:(2R)-3-sulfolactate dehydrogenase (NADP+)